MDSRQMKNLNDVYKKWEQRAAGGPYSSGSPVTMDDGLQTSNGSFRSEWLKRSSGIEPPVRRPVRSKKRGKSKDDYESLLPPAERKFHVPTAVIPGVFTRERPFMGKGCVTCCPESVELLYSESVPAKEMHNILNIAVYTRQNLFRRMFCHVNFIWNRNVGPPFPDVTNAVLNSDRIKNCILNTVYNGCTAGSDIQKEELEKKEKMRQKQLSKLEHKAKGIMSQMASGIYWTLIKFTGWFLFKLFGRLLDSIQIHKGQIQMLQQATEENKPLVFLPLHKSHLDYILVTYVLLTCDIKAPHVAAGDNLSHMTLFSWLMRHLGGFFIKRKLDHTSKDDLYKAILQEYIQQLLENGQNLEIFIEGSRSRTGKAMIPKSGILSLVVNAVLEGSVDDVMIVPVNISYEKLFETSYSRELLGEPKRPETFVEAVKGIWEVLGASYGNIRVDFAQPFSLKELAQCLNGSTTLQHFGSEMVARSSITSSPASSMLRNYSDVSLSDFGEEECFLLTKVLGYHVIYDAVQCSAVMSTNMMAFMLLNVHRNGATLEQLIYGFEELRKEIISRGRDVGFSGKIPDIVDHSLFLLNDLVEVQHSNEQTLIKPRLGIPEVIDLLHYSNLVLCIFALEAVVACSICAVAKERNIEITDIDQEQTLPQNQIIDKAKDLCELLQKEFIFAPPCESLEDSLVQTLEMFMSSEILKSLNQGSSNTRDWSYKFSVSAWDEDEENGEERPVLPDIEYKLSTSEVELSKLKHLQSLLSPIIESYWVSACGLLWLPSQDFTESEFVKAVHDCSKERVSESVTMYPESCSLEPCRNAIRIFKEMKIVEVKNNEQGQSFLRLTDSYNYDGALFELIAHINQFKT